MAIVKGLTSEIKQSPSYFSMFDVSGKDNLLFQGITMVINYMVNFTGMRTYKYDDYLAWFHGHLDASSYPYVQSPQRCQTIYKYACITRSF